MPRKEEKASVIDAARAATQTDDTKSEEIQPCQLINEVNWIFRFLAKAPINWIGAFECWLLARVQPSDSASRGYRLSI